MRLSHREKRNNNALLPAFAVFTFGFHVLGLMLLMFHGSMLDRLKEQFIPESLVQLADGRTVTVDSQKNLERHPETIRRFVAETITFLLTRSEKQPPELVWKVGSGLLTRNLQLRNSEEILNPSQKSLNGERITETVLIIQKVSQPEKLAEGNWQVELEAYQLVFTANNKLGEPRAFNKKILVRAVDEPTVFLPTNPLSWHLTAYQLGEARLEIYDICDLKAKTCP